MTRVVVCRDERGVRSLTVSGHSGYAESGRDIVCAAVSTLITTCANAMESAAGLVPLVSQDEAATEISVALPETLSPGAGARRSGRLPHRFAGIARRGAGIP